MDKLDKSLDKKTDQFLSQNLSGDEVLHAPDDFLSTVMKNIENYESSKLSIRYQPLISKTQWFLISLLVVGLLAIAFLTGDSVDLSLITYININISLSNGHDFFPFTDIFSGIELNQIFTTGIVIICIFVILNIIILRRYLLR